MKLYIITNGSNYLTVDSKNKSIVATSKFSLAQRYTKEKAENVMKSLPKPFKNIGYHLEEDWQTNKTLENIKCSSENCFKSVTPTIPTMEEEARILNEVLNFEEYLKNITKARDIFTKELSQIDSEIQDILHAIEFYNLNACEGYKIYKLLREKRLRRRFLKNFIEKVGFIERCSIEDLKNNRASKSIIGADNRSYAPRALNELFKK